MKAIITLRDTKDKRWPIIAECLSLGFSGVYSTVTEARAYLSRRFGDIEIKNITGKEN
jgi:hypothetical protein